MMDLLSSQYGWPDEYILGLTYARLVQIIDVVTERQKAEMKRWHHYAQIFYTPLAGLATGKALQLPDLFGAESAKDKSTEQFREDLWWQKPANN
jgi:hypothetical protein